MVDKLQGTGSYHSDMPNRIIAVAKKAFYAKGVKSVTMDEIAHELTMSKRTLYQIFSDKETLLMTCLDENNKEHLRLMEDKMQHTDNVLEIVLFDFNTRLEHLKQINPVFFTELSKFPKIVEKMQVDRLKHMEKAVEFMKRGVRQGLFREDVDFRIIFTLLMSHIDRVDRVDGLGKFAPIDVFKHLVFFYLRGCTTAKGMVMMDDFLEQIEI